MLSHLKMEKDLRKEGVIEGEDEHVASFLCDKIICLQLAGVSLSKNSFHTTKRELHFLESTGG